MTLVGSHHFPRVYRVKQTLVGNEDYMMGGVGSNNPGQLSEAILVVFGSHLMLVDLDR